MFQIAPDSFEDNDRQYRAYLLPTRNQTVTGNFHQLNDVDWFVLHVEQEGVLRVRMSTDTYRIDPELWIQRAGEIRAYLMMADGVKQNIRETSTYFPGNTTFAPAT